MMAVAEKPANAVGVLKLDVRTPVNSAAQIRYEIPLGATGSIAVFDASGRLVKTLANGVRNTGTATWDLRDAQGGSARNGCYFVHLNAGSNQTVSKLVLAK
jgi:acetylornithine deacetylase/succinyl-diaminopimelate desuccinylase-like protein